MKRVIVIKVQQIPLPLPGCKYFIAAFRRLHGNRYHNFWLGRRRAKKLMGFSIFNCNDVVGYLCGKVVSSNGKHFTRVETKELTRKYLCI
jgi:hypothetical protein